jgi:hypothetical protein
VLKRALSLGAPKLVSSNIYFTETIRFLANVRHLLFSFRQSAGQEASTPAIASIPSQSSAYKAIRLSRLLQNGTLILVHELKTSFGVLLQTAP